MGCEESKEGIALTLALLLEVPVGDHLEQAPGAPGRHGCPLPHGGRQVQHPLTPQVVDSQPELLAGDVGFIGGMGECEWDVSDGDPPHLFVGYPGEVTPKGGEQVVRFARAAF